MTNDRDKELPLHTREELGYAREWIKQIEHRAELASQKKNIRRLYVYANIVHVVLAPASLMRGTFLQSARAVAIAGGLAVGTVAVGTAIMKGADYLHDHYIYKILGE